MDLLTVWFMTKFLTRPMYGFGFVGIISIFFSLAISSYLIVLKKVIPNSGDFLVSDYVFVLF